MGYPWTEVFVIEGVGCELGRRGAATKQQRKLEKVDTAEETREDGHILFGTYFLLP